MLFTHGIARVSALLLVAFLLLDASSAQEPPPTASDEGSIASALERAGDNRSQIQRALDSAPESQLKAVRFLIAYMPDRDLRSLSADFILNNVGLAYRARESTTWGKHLPEQTFFNDVLPYASVNERRNDWRADFFERFMPLVKDCPTPSYFLCNRRDNS